MNGRLIVDERILAYPQATRRYCAYTYPHC